MLSRTLAVFALLAFIVTACAAASKSFPQEPSNKSAANSAVLPNSPAEKEIVQRVIDKEKEFISSLPNYSPIIETYIQGVRYDTSLGLVPKDDHYFLGQADFRGRLKVHSLLEIEKKGTWMWSYNPTGFLQMIFADGSEFDLRHYRLEMVRREFLGEVRCYVFNVKPLPKTHGPRFAGRIWVEDRDMAIVRISGYYTPALHFSFKTFEDEYYLHFDSWRTNVSPGIWLPSYIYTQELDRPTLFGNPSFKAQTRFWGYRVALLSREEELIRILVESSSVVKEEASQQDRSPLEAQREWRHQAEKNVLETLERGGLLAPAGEVEKTLDIIIKNIEITNNLEDQVDLHCRVLLTGNLEVFSVGNTIVLSRGLIDVVPDEATMAAMLAQGMADAMLPKPYQDQYAFSDIVRLTATEVLKHLTFHEETQEISENSRKAVELLQKSPYVSKLDSAGLFLKQLQEQSRSLKHLISPQLGSEVYFEARLMQAAPALAPVSLRQVAALPLGSRLKIDPWTSVLSLMKPRPASLLSPRDKMPFLITPMFPYLTRYRETPASQAPSNPPGLD